MIWWQYHPRQQSLCNESTSQSAIVCLSSNSRRSELLLFLWFINWQNCCYVAIVVVLEVFPVVVHIRFVAGASYKYSWIHIYIYSRYILFKLTFLHPPILFVCATTFAMNPRSRSRLFCHELPTRTTWH